MKARFLLGLTAGVVLTLGIGAAGVYMFRGVLAQINWAGAPDIPQDRAAATATTQAAMTKITQDLNWDDREDFDFAARGFIATREDPVIKTKDGRVAYNLAGYDFLKGEPPATVNPSLWRQAQILTKHGLFKVADGIYQVRGFDVSTVTFIVTEAGYVAVDPLTTAEVAAAAYELVKQHVGDRPIAAVIYSHSHADHFGGVRGVVSDEDVASGRVKIIAPEGFMEHAVSENIIAGNAMGRRARFQFGHTLEKGPEGEVTSGLGPGLSRGTLTLIAPTDLITRTGEEHVIGGVRFVFQLTPGTEAPAEMNFHLPQMRALFMAENANATMHNLLPARGALVRDAKAWADYLTEAIRLYADESDVMFAAHGLPRFGQDTIRTFLSKHRDAYKFLHDQTVRLMNAGLTQREIAEVLELPPVLARQWYNRGYYGTMSHNSKAIYQRYLGWYDANPANLNPLPPEDESKRMVEALGGRAAVVEKAKAAVAASDLRWAATLLNYAVFADGGDTEAKALLADVYTQLGYVAEAGTWRNIYLTGAQELRHGVIRIPGVGSGGGLDMIRATPSPMLLDLAAVRLSPVKAAGVRLKLNLVFPDFNERHFVSIENGVLIHETGVSDPGADATVTMARQEFLMTVLAGVPVLTRTTAGAIIEEGRAGAFAEFTGLFEAPDSSFNVVTP